LRFSKTKIILFINYLNFQNMKKKILGGIALLGIAAVAAWNVNLNSQSSDLSDVSLANVEALANGESSSKSIDCWQEISSSHSNAMSAELTHKTYCGECSAKLDRSWSSSSSCSK
jgi:hypothetical protein